MPSSIYKACSHLECSPKPKAFGMALLQAQEWFNIYVLGGKHRRMATAPTHLASAWGSQKTIPAGEIAC